jgi:hypothetical protein
LKFSSRLFSARVQRDREKEKINACEFKSNRFHFEIMLRFVRQENLTTEMNQYDFIENNNTKYLTIKLSEIICLFCFFEVQPMEQSRLLHQMNKVLHGNSIGIGLF